MRKIVLMGKMAIVAGVVLGLLGIFSFHGSASQTERQNDSLKAGMSSSLTDRADSRHMTPGVLQKNNLTDDGNRAVQMLIYGLVSSFLGVLLLKISEE